MNIPVPPEAAEPRPPPPSRLDPEACEARNERQLAYLARLSELGMARAERAARAAQLESERASAAEPGPGGASAARGRMDALASAFVRDGRFVAAVIGQEARLAANLRAQARSEAREDRGAPRRLPDPVRLLARRQLRQWAEKTPSLENLKETFKDIEERLEDPDVKTILGRGLPACRIVAVVAEDLGIEVDWSKVPDEVMGVAWLAGERRGYFPHKDPKNQGGPFGYPVEHLPAAPDAG